MYSKNSGGKEKNKPEGRGVSLGSFGASEGFVDDDDDDDDDDGGCIGRKAGGRVDGRYGDEDALYVSSRPHESGGFAAEGSESCYCSAAMGQNYQITVYENKDNLREQ